ncbi:MAG: glycosyltransferase [Candidatus Portnoybacteria bacterium]|nr:glycosyltransferase [Candidatus Portnoybacteria bacterium]
MKLLMITGDTALAQGKKGPFYYMLQEFSKYWDRIDIICPKTKQEVSKVHNNTYIHVSTKNKIFHPKYILKKGKEIIEKQNTDFFTIHSYPPFYNDIGGKKLHKKTKTPYALEIMHITGYPKAANIKEKIYRTLTRIFIRKFSKNAKIVRVINKKQVPEFLKRAGVKENKIKYIPAFYIDLNTFQPQQTEKKYDIVFSGRLTKNKGIFLLLKAVKEIEASLIITGTGPLKGKIEKYIKDNKLEKKIKLAGWLPTTKDIANIYNQSRMMVMPSFNEGGPRVTLEAMACKTPVITTRVGIMLDIIKDKENGLFIDWDKEDIKNKISILLKDKELIKKIAENGYKTIQQFERKESIKNYAQTYKNLLHNS